MSIVRLSVLKDKPYAPKADGDIVLAAYDKTKANARGAMTVLAPPDLAPPSDPLRHYLQKRLALATSGLAAGQPIVVMVHGFLFDPRHAVAGDPKETDNPHGRLYHFRRRDGEERDEQRHHTSSWPRGLGFSRSDSIGGDGLAVAFGWHSQPGFATSLIHHFQNFYARAYEHGEKSAWVLVNVLDELARIIPASHPIDIFCHSLGGHVVVRALALAAKEAAEGEKAGRRDAMKRLIRRLGRVLILGGSEYVVEAQLMYRRIQDVDVARRPDFYNFVSRENDVLDILGENFGPRTFGNSQVIGHNGLDIPGTRREARPTDWIDLQIDSAELQGWMADRNFDIAGDRPGNVWDHWYYYTYRGNMKLYRKILRDRSAWDIARLREDGIPDGVSKRWSLFGD